MTNEVMLQLVKDTMKCMSKFDNGYASLEKLEAGITENIREEIVKKSGGKKSDLSIVKNITKIGDKKKDIRWNHYHPFRYNGIEYKAFLEGHYILAGQSDFGYEEAEKPFEIIKMIPDDAFDGIKIHIDMNDLKLFSKTEKRSEYGDCKHGKPYIIETDQIRIGFNPFYLLDTLEFNETDIIYISKPKAPAFVKNDKKLTFGMVLPINLLQ